MTDGAMLADNAGMAPSPFLSPPSPPPATLEQWEAYAAALRVEFSAVTAECNLLKSDLARERAARRVIDAACKDLIEALSDMKEEQAIVAKEVNP